MATTRPAAVAGLFYPNEPAVLARDVDRMLADVSIARRCPKLLIVPHAGYVYSGPVAATGYAQIREAAGHLSRVVVLGPAHRVYCQGLAASSADAFRTPLGDVPVDRECLSALCASASVTVRDDVHANEHSLEVQLPFLQRTLGEFQLVPLLVGDAATDETDSVLSALWGGAETLIVISTDLSHFLDYASACRTDAQTTRLIENRCEQIGPRQACGCRALAPALRIAKRHGLDIETLDLRNSGDTVGGRDRVVGYGTYMAAS